MRYSSGTGRQLRAERKRLRTIFYGLGIIILLYLFLSLVFGERGVLTYLKLKASYNNLQQELAEIKKDNTILESEVQLLKKKDSFLIEKKAREDLNMAREDEYIFIFKDKEQ